MKKCQKAEKISPENFTNLEIPFRFSIHKPRDSILSWNSDFTNYEGNYNFFVYISYVLVISCLFKHYICQLFVYIFIAHVSCLFTFILLQSAVCLHLQ